jgi:hypothetical protein
LLEVREMAKIIQSHVFQIPVVRKIVVLAKQEKVFVINPVQKAIKYKISLQNKKRGLPSKLATLQYGLLIFKTYQVICKLFSSIQVVWVTKGVYPKISRG